MPRVGGGIQYAAASRFKHKRLWNTGSPGQARATTRGEARIHRRRLGELDIDLAQPVGHRAGLAVGDHLAVDRHHRLHEHAGAGDEGFLGGQRFLDRKRPLLDAKLALFGQRDHGLAGAARQDRAAVLPRHDHVVLGQDEARRRAALGHLAVLDHPGLAGAGHRRRLLGQHLRQQRHALDVAPGPAQVGHRDHLDAGLGRGRVDDVLGGSEHDQRRLDALGKREVAPGIGAARHFQIDHAVDEIVARDQLLLDLLDARRGFRQRQLDLADRTLQPRQMRGVVDQFAVEDGGDLIDAVGKQESAIEDRDLRL